MYCRLDSEQPGQERSFVEVVCRSDHLYKRSQSFKKAGMYFADYEGYGGRRRGGKKAFLQVQGKGGLLLRSWWRDDILATMVGSFSLLCLWDWAAAGISWPFRGNGYWLYYL